jgi:hypothetical protein
MPPANASVRGASPLHALGAAVEMLFLGDWGRRLATPLARAAVLLVAAVLAGFLSYKAIGNQITETNILHEDRVSLALYLQGTADKPFAYRLLTPVLVRFAEHALDAPDILRALPGPLAERLPGWCAAATSNPAPTCDDVAAYVAVAGAQCFVFLLLVYAFCLRMFGNPLVALFGLGFAFFGVDAVLLQRLSHVYDFGVMMMVTLLLVCLQRRWAVAFTLLLPLAFLTKETLVLYAGGFFLANLGRMEAGRNLALFLVQLLSFAVIHGMVRAHFADNGGLGHEYYLPLQIHYFTEQIGISALIQMTVALVLVFYRFGDKDLVLRRVSIVILPWFVLFLIGGVEKELRVVFEVLPIILLLTIDSLVRLVPGFTARAAFPRVG